MNKSIILTYHDIVSDDKALLLYDVRLSEFKKHAQIVRDIANRNGASLRGAQAEPRAMKVVLTFDDGYKSWANAVLDTLREYNLKAYFFVCIKHIEEEQITIKDIIRLKEAGMTIGSHSMSHRYLNTLSELDIYTEMSESKRVLEKIVDAEVRFFSVPYGNSSPRIIKAAHAAGYRAVFTSRVGTNPHGAFSLNRVAVRRNTDIAAFKNLTRGKGIGLLVLKSALKDCVKRIVGVENFHAIRNAMVSRAE